MKNKGFYIKSVIAVGDGMITSRVDFNDGCNLLFGPSEMGKSSVFSLIDFMLGKKDAPKLPPEGQGYNTFYMEIITKEDAATHTVKRLLKDKSVTVKDCTYELFENKTISGVAYPISATNKKKTYSQYLMELNGFEGDLQLRKSTTDKASFTYTWIRHLILADENRIVSETPIFNPSDEKVSATQEKSVIYYLTTGEDDSNFISQEKAEHRNLRYTGMIEITKESIEEINRKIQALGDVSFAGFKDETAMKALQSKISEDENKLKSLYERRAKLEDEKRQLMSKQMFVNEFIKRMEMLENHYITDLGRYEYLFDGANLFSILTETHVCPVCNSEIIDKTQINDEFLASIQKEYDQVKAKLKDIKDVIEKKKKEMLHLLNKINTITHELDGVATEVNNFSSQLLSIKNLLARYQENIEKKTEARFLQEESQRLYKKLAELEKEKAKRPAAPEYKRETSINEEFCSLVKEKLVYWNVLKENEPVVFDENGFDFVLGGKERITCGKGARGVTCAAILLSLLEYCLLKDIPFSNVIVLDSPITAHFSDGKQFAEQTTQTRFFKYCNDNIKDYQLIIIDNKSPEPNDRANLTNINYIEFSKDGRNGFYLGKMEKD